MAVRHACLIGNYDKAITCGMKQPQAFRGTVQEADTVGVRVAQQILDESTVISQEHSSGPHRKMGDRDYCLGMIAEVAQASFLKK